MRENEGINIFELLLVILILLSIAGNVFYFFELLNPSQSVYNPFSVYNQNPGIIKISILSFLSAFIFVFCFILQFISVTKYTKTIKVVYLIAAICFALLQWYELYYGSTFYYGEVRDKQGIWFPILASLMFTLVIWKVNYRTKETIDMRIKLILTGLVNSGLYGLWLYVCDSWNLWQS